MVRAGYKQTDAGLIPKDWNSKRIDAACRVINGRAFKPFEWASSGLPIVRIQNLNGSKQFNYFDGDCSEKFEIKAGQLLFAWSGSRGTSFGPHIWPGPHGLLNYHTWKIELDHNVATTEFFYYALRGLTSFIEGKAHGASALVHTQKWEMEAFEIALPPTLTEQKAIATALSDMDALIEAVEQLITKKRHIKQGAMQELLTGRRRLPGFDGEWQQRSLGEVLTVCHGKNQHDVEVVDGNYPILATGGEIGRTNEYLHEGPAVLIGRKGTIDRPRYMATPFWTVDTLYYCDIVRPNSAKFLFYRFGLINWRQHNEASGVPSLNSKTIERILIEVPTASEQEAIATTLSDMDDELKALEIKITKLRHVKQGMMHNLLTGRIRLV